MLKSGRWNFGRWVCCVFAKGFIRYIRSGVPETRTSTIVRDLGASTIGGVSQVLVYFTMIFCALHASWGVATVLRTVRGVFFSLKNSIWSEFLLFSIYSQFSPHWSIGRNLLVPYNFFGILFHIQKFILKRILFVFIYSTLIYDKRKTSTNK